MKPAALSAWLRLVVVFLIGLTAAEAPIGGGPAWAQKTSVVRELHVVGVYEGAEDATDADDARPAISVLINRPGARVNLVLMSYDPVRWKVKATAQTTIESITLSGYKIERSVVYLGDAEYGATVRRKDLGYIYEARGPGFRRMVETLPADFDLERIKSFSGRYAATLAGFSIGKTLPDDPRLNPDYLASYLAKPNTLPDIRFPALINGEAGLYSLTGRKVGEAEFVDTNTSVYVSDDFCVYRFSGAGFTSRPVRGGKERTFSPPFNLPEVSWATALTWDPKRHRLVGITLGGEGYAYSYDLQNGSWLPARSLQNMDAHVIKYDSARDRYVVVESMDGLRLRALSPQLQLSEIDTIKRDQLAGIDDLGDPLVDILYIDKRYIVLAATGTEVRRRAADNTPLRIWLYDLDKRTAALTWRKR
jgi:hypothetical protein